MVQLLVQDLSDLQKIKYNKFQSKSSQFDVKKAIWDTVNINEVFVKTKMSWFNVEIMPNTPAMIEVDSDRVIQIL